jgi:hypothetical protein
MRLLALALLGMVPWSGVLEAQTPVNNTCRFRLVSTGRQGVTQGDNMFAGGGVVIKCNDLPVTMSSDSVAYYAPPIDLVQFIGNVKYEDTTITMTANNGTYFKSGERWEARGNVVTRNLETGSTLTGPSLDYYRVLKGVRDTIEMYAIGRPRINYVPQDSAGQPEEPYVINADRVRMKGNDRVWAAGRVTIDRSDFAATGDSMRLDTGPTGDGTLIGNPILRGLGSDSFNLQGRRIDLDLDEKALSYVLARGNGHAVTTDLDLVADTIGLDVDNQKLVQTIAWGDSIRPYASSTDFAMRADSLAFDTPGQKLTESRAYGEAWVGGSVDSASTERDCSNDYRICDWLVGDTITARFAQRDSAGTSRTVLQQVNASRAARAHYRTESQGNSQRGVTYSRADRIIITMKTGEKQGVDQVELQGAVDGVQLDPLKPSAAPADSTRPRPPTRGNGQ